MHLRIDLAERRADESGTYWPDCDEPPVDGP